MKRKVIYLYKETHCLKEDGYKVVLFAIALPVIQKILNQ